MPEKYRMYVDEVGNPDYGSADNPNHRFLSLTGVILSLRTVSGVLHPALEALKTEYFGQHPDEPIILHRKEMVNQTGPFIALRDQTIRGRFDRRLLQLLRETDYTVITVVIDKLEHRRRYTTWQHDPYHYCLEVLLERYVLFLNRCGFIGDVMAESRGGREDLRLKKSFARLCEGGTHFLNRQIIDRVLTSKQLKVKSKHNNIAGLQLADILAHPSRREILIENGKIVDQRENLVANEIIGILQSKYDRNGSVYGKKLLP